MRIIPKIVDRLRRAADALKVASAPTGTERAQSDNVVLDEYVAGMPNAQNAIDALAGWNQALPPQANVVAGVGAFYQDPRILWALDQFGSLESKKILELGPLEASHTWLLEQHGPGEIHAIEANKLSYLRCLVVKELLDIKKAKFHLGDFEKWLENTDHHYDLIVASGVLYHMADPIHLLERIAAKTDAFYVWTHYVSEAAMPVGDPRRGAMLGEQETQLRHGVPVRLYPRSYHGAWRNKSFCGGMHDLHRWLEKDDIISIIRALGFDDVRVAHDEPNQPNGPAFSIFARRKPVDAPAPSDPANENAPLAPQADSAL